ncbi:hypothetical protein [Glycomyces sp. NPDC047010]|uniref:mechanosensitive ion channel family protein n=1 Tax=Glycomyces sp. NPDC047010 TaxID=3155023 RepID=UPI0033D994A8
MNFTQSFQNMMDSVIAFLPRALAFIAILVVGWFISKWIGRLVGKLLNRVGLDRVGERSGLRRFTGKFELSDLLGRVVYFMLLLFTLQLAFGAFGTNPVSTLLNQLVGWLPLLFVALVIVVVAFAIANAVFKLVDGTLENASYGRTVARICQVAIIFFGAVAAFGQVGIATTVTTPIMWTVLSIIAGVTIVGVGGGLVAPMRERWERMLSSAETEAGRMRDDMQEQGTHDATASMSTTYSSDRYGAEANTQVQEPTPPAGAPAMGEPGATGQGMDPNTR